MQIEPDPSGPGGFRASCSGNETGASASPPRRLVEFAGKMYQELGEDHVIIQSICAEDFRPVLWALTSKLHDYHTHHYRQLEMNKDPSDPRGCTCLASCTMIEVMPDDGPCPPFETPYFTWDRNGDGITDEKDAFIIDEDGKRYTTCEVPQLPTLISGCPCCLSGDEPGCTCELKCDEIDAWLVQASSETGWWHLPYFYCQEQGHDYAETKIALSPAISSRRPHPEIICNNRVCPLLQACGPTSLRSSWCCDVNEYCWEGKCMIRPDICAEYGNDLWCPDPNLPHGGLCCLDHNFDGTLDVLDRDGDGPWDRSAFYCDGRQCVQRP